MKEEVTITLPKRSYDAMVQEYINIQEEFKTFKSECEKDSKYIIISHKYDIGKHLSYTFNNNPLLGLSPNEYLNTYEGTTYESFLKDAAEALNKTNLKEIDNLVKMKSGGTFESKYEPVKENKWLKLLTKLNIK